MNWRDWSVKVPREIYKQSLRGCDISSYVRDCLRIVTAWFVNAVSEQKATLT